MIEFNGYKFYDSDMVRRMKYIIVKNGQLDVNGCYAFANKKSLKYYLKDNTNSAGIQAIFEIKRHLNLKDSK